MATVQCEQILPPQELLRRASAIRLNQLDLSERSGLSQKQTGHILHGRVEPRLDSIRALQGAVVADERRLLTYLLGLHGVPADFLPQPTPEV